MKYTERNMTRVLNSKEVSQKFSKFWNHLKNQNLKMNMLWPTFFGWVTEIMKTILSKNSIAIDPMGLKVKSHR